jgi:hypothetical protein
MVICDRGITEDLYGTCVGFAMNGGMSSCQLATIRFLHHEQVLLAYFLTHSLCLHSVISCLVPVSQFWSHIEFYMLVSHEDFLYMSDTKLWIWLWSVKFGHNPSALKVEAACSSEMSVSTWQDCVVSKPRNWKSIYVRRLADK